MLLGRCVVSCCQCRVDESGIGAVDVCGLLRCAVVKTSPLTSIFYVCIMDRGPQRGLQGNCNINSGKMNV